MLAEVARAAQRSAAAARRPFEAGTLWVCSSAAEAGLNSGTSQMGKQMLAGEVVHSEETNSSAA